MNDEVFVDEVNKYIKQCLSEFNIYRSMVWEIFTVFNKLCNENELNYYQAFGTLIGAVRDCGNIPWDYDMDVLISIDDRSKLINILEHQLPPMYYYVYSNVEEEYPTTCLRICKKGYPFTSIHLDVFFAIGCPDDEPQKYVMLINKLYGRRSKKYSGKWFAENIEKTTLRKRVRHYIGKIHKATISSRRITKDEEVLYHKYSLKKSQYFCIPGDPYLHYYHTEDFLESNLIDIHGEKVRIPKGYDRYLKTVYGDYMRYPTIESRFDELYNMLRIIHDRQSKYETSALYNKYK